MGSWSRVRAAKCQMLATSCFVLLLGLCVATATLLTHFGAHFAVVSRVSPEGSPYKALHHWAFYAGIGLAGLLTLGAALSATATVREAGGLMAGVEDAMLDVYDLVYDQAVKGRSGARWQELVAIQDTFRCCGKNGPSSLLGSGQAELCRGEEAVRQDCLRAIGSFLRTHRHVTSALTGAGLAAMVYAMLLSSFLWLAIHEGRSLHRKGAYALSPRAHGGRPQEPSFFRRFEDTHAPPPLSEEDALNDRLGPSRHLGGRRPLQDS
ncbi:tetraspanin-32 isoform X2 [Rousettus aegyptiacus]|uniref:tetraspanin-32 isoform X2 n=1 Tax=Rousettus aegyptiacus TaxID=9407 RepID=UPI00168CACFC|nr:tetraspanin-32 isoform X2 [Rousettus aegyptiacus]